MSGGRESEDDLSNAWRVLFVAGVAQMIPSINLSIMYVVYPEVQREFSGTSAGALSWVLNGYTIVAAATLVLGGVVADRTGRKRALLAGSALSLAAVLVCGSAPNANTLLCGRILLALAASLLSTPDLFGFDVGSYLWRGRGLYTQAWGMCLLPLTIAAALRLMISGRGVAVAAALLAGTLLTHVVHGWIAVVSALVLAFVVPADAGLPRRLGRLALALAGAGLAASYFLIPYVLNHAELNRSVAEPLFKYDSYGHGRVLKMLVTGQLLDAGRWPVLTVLLAVGIVVAARRRAPWDRALLALRSVQSRVEAIEPEAPLVSVRPDEGHTPLELGRMPCHEGAAQQLFDGVRRRWHAAFGPLGLVRGVHFVADSGQALVRVAHARQQPAREA